MGIFIFFNKSFKGRWRKVMAILYCIHIALLFGMINLDKQQWISRSTYDYLLMAWMGIVVCIFIYEIAFFKSLKNKIVE